MERNNILNMATKCSIKCSELFVDGFVLLKTLNGKGLLHLTSLSNLSGSMCPQIQSLPEEGLPYSVTFLSIWGCPSLNQCCQRDRGAKETEGKIGRRLLT